MLEVKKSGHYRRLSVLFCLNRYQMKVADATANAIERTFNTKWLRGNSCKVLCECNSVTSSIFLSITFLHKILCHKITMCSCE